MSALQSPTDVDRKRREEAWSLSVERPTQAELVPTEFIAPFREYDREIGHDTHTSDLRAHIADHGVCESIKLEYDPDTGIAHVGEGNHRLTIAEELGIESLPVEILCSNRRPNRGGHACGHPGAPLPGAPAPDCFGYVPGHMKPSEVGLPIVPPR